MEEVGRAKAEELHWMMAASAHEPDMVRARYIALSRGAKKITRLDEFMARKAAEKRAREAAN